MRLKLLAAALLVPFALAGSACDSGSDKIDKNLIGTWVRQKVIQPGDELSKETDTWTLTFREDGTFTSVHRHEETVAYTPIVETTAREGEYAVGGDGTISISGGWAQGLEDVTNLGDLAEVFWSFTQDSMYLLNEAGNALFLGPDFNHDSVYAAGDSYDLLFSDGGSSYLRESSLVLTDGAGTIVEQRVESYAYTLVDDLHCSVTYSFSNVYASGPIDGSGTATDCEYAFEPDKQVDNFDGGQTAVPVIRFTYTVEGVEKNDNFAQVGDALVSYQPSMQTTVLTDHAYIKQ